jgi:hypothetical protein
MRVWGPEDYANEGLTNAEYEAVQARGMDVVDTQFYSGAQLSAMTREELDRLMPIGGYDPQGTNQYLVLQPQPTSPQYDPNGMEIDNSGTGPMPVPVAGGQVQSPAGTQAPSVQTSQIPVQGRTRRNPETGGLEFLIDGEWRSSE